MCVPLGTNITFSKSLEKVAFSQIMGLEIEARCICKKHGDLTNE